jgi:lipopolysaccharide export system protein LptA
LKDYPLKLQYKIYIRRRKGLRGLLALVLLSTAAAVVVALWAAAHRKASVTKPTENLPQNLAQRVSSSTINRSEQGRAIFTLHAARTLAYDQGSNRLLEDVHVVMFGRNGHRHDEIQTQRCVYDTVTGSLACSGQADLTLPPPTQEGAARGAVARPPVLVHTSDVSYDPRTFLVTTKAAARFQYGLDSGAAIGLAYNTQKGWLDLKREVTFEIEPQSASKAPVRVTAGGLHYVKESGRISLRAPVKISEADRELTGSTAILDLDSRGRATQAIVTGAAEGFAVSPKGTFHGTSDTVVASIDPQTSQVQRLDASGSVDLSMQQPGQQGRDDRSLSAQHMVLDFSGQKSRPEAGVATGDVQLAFESIAGNSRSAAKPRAGNPGSAGERFLTATELKFSFRPDGTLDWAVTVGPGKIRLVPEKNSASRQTITAGKLLMVFDTKGRLETVRGFAGTQILNQPGPKAPRGTVSQTSAGDNLKATLDTSKGTLKTLFQTGHFQFWQADRRASADAAEYNAATETVTLQGRPLVWDADDRLRAPHINIYTGKGVARGWGGVQSVSFGHKAAPGTQKKPALVPQTDSDSTPLIVLADQVIAIRGSQFGHYQGHVRALYGSDVVESPSLDIYKRQERVVSGAGVVSSFVQQHASSNSPSKSSASAQRAEQPLTIRADRLVYFHLGEEAVYSGHVRAVSENTALRADRLEVYFSKVAGNDQPAVTRAVADGNVNAVQPYGRRASGQHAVYFADSGKIVLTGGPPIIYDAKQGVVTGRRLTFFTHDASLLADGGPKAPAVSRYHVTRQ